MVQLLINSKGLQMNPLQSLYYISPACLMCLSLPLGAASPKVLAISFSSQTASMLAMLRNQTDRYMKPCVRQWRRPYASTMKPRSAVGVGASIHVCGTDRKHALQALETAC